MMYLWELCMFLLILFESNCISGTVATDDKPDNSECHWVGSVSVSMYNTTSKKMELQPTVPLEPTCTVLKGVCKVNEEGAYVLDNPVEGKGLLKDSGKFGESSLKINISGALIPMQSYDSAQNRSVLHGCSGTFLHKLPKGLKWIALIERGECTFQEKLDFALKHNASGVIVFNHIKRENEPELITMDHGVHDLVTILIHGDIGMNILVMSSVAFIDTGKYLQADITYIKKVCSFSNNGKNSVTVMVVAITFVVVMMVSLVWLVFYYIQRHRNINRTDKIRDRLEKAVRKSLRRLGERTVLEGDEETHRGSDDGCTYCLDGFRVGEVIRELPCRHKFHKICVDSWLVENRTCPNCKQDILLAMGVTIKGLSDEQQNADTVISELAAIDPGSVQMLAGSQMMVVGGPFSGSQYASSQQMGSQYLTSQYMGSQCLGSQYTGSQGFTANGNINSSTADGNMDNGEKESKEDSEQAPLVGERKSSLA